MQLKQKKKKKSFCLQTFVLLELFRSGVWCVKFDDHFHYFYASHFQNEYQNGLFVTSNILKFQTFNTYLWNSMQFCIYTIFETTDFFRFTAAFHHRKKAQSKRIHKIVKNWHIKQSTHKSSSPKKNCVPFNLYHVQTEKKCFLTAFNHVVHLHQKLASENEINSYGWLFVEIYSVFVVYSI